MEQTALRPKPMPGQEPEGAAAVTGPGPSRPRPHAARRRGRRLLNVLLASFAGAVLVLSGIGLGAMGTAVLGKGGRFDPRGWQHMSSLPGPTRAAAAPAAPAAATLGVQVMDARKPGAVVVGLHVPGRRRPPGWCAATSSWPSARPGSTPPPIWSGPSPAPGRVPRSDSRSVIAVAATSS